MFLPKRKCALFFSVCSMTLLLICILKQSNTVYACSSRSVAKPRTLTSSASSILPQRSTTSTPTTTSTTTTTEPTTSTTTTPRPNITFPTYKCPVNYDAWYCLNDATCFSVKLGDSVMYNCECANGFMGPRCEYKEYDASFLPKRPRPMLEEASIASGAICALLFVVIICLTLYFRYEQRSKELSLGGEEYEVADACDDDDDDEHGECSYFTTKPCRYCNEKDCCGAEVKVAAGRSVGMHGRRGYVGGEGGGVAPALRRYIDAISMSFAIRRTTKL